MGLGYEIFDPAIMRAHHVRGAIHEIGHAFAVKAFTNRKIIFAKAGVQVMTQLRGKPEDVETQLLVLLSGAAAEAEFLDGYAYGHGDDAERVAGVLEEGKVPRYARESRVRDAWRRLKPFMHANRELLLAAARDLADGMMTAAELEPYFAGMKAPAPTALEAVALSMVVGAASDALRSRFNRDASKVLSETMDAAAKLGLVSRPGPRRAPGVMGDLRALLLAKMAAAK